MTEQQVGAALAHINELGSIVGHVPLEVRVWLEEIIQGRDAAAQWLAGELAALVREVAA